MQQVDGVWYVSLAHWGMFPVDTRFTHWESDADDWEKTPFEMDMQRAANMLKKMKELKACGNRTD